MAGNIAPRMSAHMRRGAADGGVPIKCDCGKLVAYKRGGRIFIMCKHCKKQIDILDFR